MIKLYDENSDLNLIIKTAGNSCNINCKYCFEKIKNVANYQINPQDLKNILNSIKKKCSIVFHGGEPLIIGKKNFCNLLNVIREYFPKKVNIVRIQTNGTLIDNEWLDIIYNKYKDLNIEIAISLDGNEYMNQLRVDYNGINTFKKVRTSYRLLEKWGKSAGMLSVISKKSLNYYNEYINFISSIPNIKFVKINALFNIENNKLTKDSITPIEYANFIENSAIIYIKTKLYKKLAIEPLLSILQRINNIESRYCNYSCRKCFNFICIYPDGKIGPCDCLSINEFELTNLNNLSKSIFLEDTIIKTISSTKYNTLNEIISKCNNCDIQNFCNGGCLSQRYYFKNNKNLYENYCLSKHKLFECFSKLFINKKEYTNND
ncbi:radical SAM protein [Megamonas funiformis]